MNRLHDLPTLKIDSSRRIRFKFDDKLYEGYAGDTVVSALHSAGVRIFGRSIKYHRPRGLYSLDGECSNCLMQIDGVPNMRAENTLIQEGMVVKPQNVVGSAQWDWWGLMDKLDWAMPAGFYYRAFHKPYDMWPFFMNRIRQAAGIGRLNRDFKPGRRDEIHFHTDVCVLGGGPAGLRAALTAAGYGLRVTLIEARPWLGGFWEWRVSEHEDRPLNEKARELANQVRDRGNIRVFAHTYVTGLWGDNLITAFQVGEEEDGFEERYVEVRAKSVVTATGCIERPLLFENNDRPGVMQVNCAHRLVRTYGLLPGKSAVFAVGDDLGLEAAVDLADLGLKVLAVADCRITEQNPKWEEALADRNIPFLRGWTALKADGDKTLTGVHLTSMDGLKKRKFNTPVLVASAGLTPKTGPLSLIGTPMVYEPRTNFYLPEKLPPGLHLAGRILGYAHPDSIEVSGQLAGAAAALDAGAAAEQDVQTLSDQLAGLPPTARGSKMVTPPGLKKNGKAFICFDEDATVKHIAQSFQMGFDVPELAKRFTAAGTGPGQGGIPGHNLPLLLAQYRGEEFGHYGSTTVRPPLVPVQLATLAGPSHHMVKVTPMHAEQEKLGAAFRQVGVWKRARYFGSDAQAREEIAQVHQKVGIIDVSTLGKFRLFGPDAEKILQRVYIGDMTQVPTDRAKYVAMLNDDGCLIDDGVMVRQGENDYYFTTSTARAGQTAEWLRYHGRYENWDFHLVNLTDGFGAINVAGPNAREVLQKLSQEDLSAAAFPYLGVREIDFSGIPTRVMRLGFVGELSFEIHVPASLASALWDEIMAAGREWGIRPFGLEAQSVLRLEKGHVIIGQDTEIRANLIDLGLGFLWKRDKPEARTVGAPALRFAEHQTGRLKLAGFSMVDPCETPGDGSIIVGDDSIFGFVTSCRHSLLLGQTIGLALVEDHLAEVGSELDIYQGGRGGSRMKARVVPRPFYDPKGYRLKI